MNQPASLAYSVTKSLWILRSELWTAASDQDRNFSSTDADLIFARVVPKAGRGLGFIETRSNGETVSDTEDLLLCQGQRRISITEFEKDGWGSTQGKVDTNEEPQGKSANEPL